MSVRVGVIGAGAFGREHVRAYSAVPGAQLVSVEDREPARAQALADEWGVIPDGRPADAVSVVVPEAARGSLVVDLIARGAAVLIEKPLAGTLAHARLLERLGRGRPVMVGHVVRFAVPYCELESRARAWGGLDGGRLVRRRSADHARLYPHDDVIGLTMIHDLDAVSWLADSRPVLVSASGQRGEDGRWVACEAHLTMVDGSHWSVRAEWVGGEADQRDEATITAPGGRSASVALGIADAAVYDDALVAELAHFIDRARDGMPSERLAMSDAVHAVAVAQAVRESLDQAGAPIDVP